MILSFGCVSAASFLGVQQPIHRAGVFLHFYKIIFFYNVEFISYVCEGTLFMNSSVSDPPSGAAPEGFVSPRFGLPGGVEQFGEKIGYDEQRPLEDDREEV
jgi:hypothetical protein